jgi:chromosomal replication initiation ATPase DnaA
MTVHTRFPALPSPHRASAGELIARVGAWHGYSRSDIVGPRRFRPVVAARFDAIAAVKQAYPTLSLNALGRIFGGRNHATILNALRQRGM